MVPQHNCIILTKVNKQELWREDENYFLDKRQKLQRHDRNKIPSLFRQKKLYLCDWSLQSMHIVSN